MNLRRLLLAAFAGLLLSPARAQDPQETFRGIPWGATQEQLVAANLGKLVETNGVYVKQWVNSPEGQFLTGFPFLFPNQILVFQGKRKERVECYMARGKLCLVVQRPGLHETFAPDTVIEALDATYGKSAKRVERRDMSLPATWGKIAGGTEFLEVIEWENEKGLVRVACRTWSGNERREILRVAYISKTMREENVRIAEEERIKAEEEARRLAEELKKKQEAAAAAKAAAAAAAKPGQPKPAAPRPAPKPVTPKPAN
jgi:hypothetical protein